MGSGTSSFQSKETSICLDEDVFGKIYNQSPNTAVPIEIKPKRKLNGGQKRVSLRGDSVNNRSSSFFSNLSSNKNNGSLVSFISINKSEYKRQNEKLKHELDDIKNKMSSQIQNLLTSNVTLKNKNFELKSEINQIKFTKKKIHKELVCALDNQLAMKENVQFYQQKVNELQNAITVQGKNTHHVKSLPKIELFSKIINNQILTAFLEFMITSQKIPLFELSCYKDIVIAKKRIIIFICKNLDSKVSSKMIDELLVLFASLISNFSFTDIIIITSSMTDIKEYSCDCHAIIVLDDSNCSCSTGIEFLTGKSVHLVKYATKKRQCPPMEEISKLLTKYNILEMALAAGLQLCVMNLWQCDVHSFSPMVFDYAFFFMQCKHTVFAQKVNKIQFSNDSCHDFEFHLNHIKKSLYVSCSNLDACLFVSYLQRICKGELLVVSQIGARDSYNDLIQKIFASIFYQVKLESKYFTIANQSLFEIVDYLSLYFKVTIAIVINSTTLTQCLENFLLAQKKSQSVCIIFGPSVLVKVIQLCDSIYLSHSHIPAMKHKPKLTTLKSTINLVEKEYTDHCYMVAQLLTVFQSGLSDSCLKNILGLDPITFYDLKKVLINAKIIIEDAGLIELCSQLCSLEPSQLPKKITTMCLQHFVKCRNYHLHLNDVSMFFRFSSNIDAKHAIARNPEALAYHVYNKTSSLLINELSKYSKMDRKCLLNNFQSFYCTNYPSSEQVLIFRIIAQLYYSDKAHYQSRYFSKLSQDLEVYFGFEPCFSNLGLYAKLSTERFKVCNTELMLYEACCYAIRNKLLDEAIKMLLLQSGILKSMENSHRSRKCFEHACSVFHHHTELIEIEHVFGYCLLLSVIKRSTLIDSVLQGLVSKLSNNNSGEIICMVLTSYASYHISKGKYSCAISLLEYVVNSFKIQSDLCRSKSFRLLALTYMKMNRPSDAVNLYKVFLGKDINYHDLSDISVFEDVYNYVIALIKIHYFGSAYDIMKSVNEWYPSNLMNNGYRHKVSSLLKYLRSVISKCKPSSGHYRADTFL